MVMTAAAENSDHPEIERFVDAMWIEKGLSDNTLNAYRHDLRQFNAFLGADRGRTIMQASRADLQRYLGSRLGDGGSQRSAARLMSCLRGFYRYQLRETRLTVDPTLDVDSPKLGRPLPRNAGTAVCLRSARVGADIAADVAGQPQPGRDSGVWQGQ